MKNWNWRGFFIIIICAGIGILLNEHIIHGWEVFGAATLFAFLWAWLTRWNKK